MKMRHIVMLGAFGLCPIMATAQPTGEMEAAREILLELQSRSFAENREYCGYIGLMPDGTYMATEVTRGTSDSCLSRGDESPFVEVTASFHTHAGYDPDADSEVPSVEDLAGDIDEGVNGYVATPGGRLWFNDGGDGVAYLICGPNCMGQDPRYREDVSDPIQDSYSLDELEDRQSGW